MKRIAVVIALLASLLVVLPTAAASISVFTLSPAKVSGGAYSTATVYLASAAPAGGQVVALSSSDPTVASLQSSLTIAAGTTSWNVRITAFEVAVSTAILTVAPRCWRR